TRLQGDWSSDVCSSDLVARTEDAYRGLRNLVRRRALERRYKALVHGRPQSWRGRIDAPIGRDRHEPTRMSLDTDRPRDAVTHFEIGRAACRGRGEELGG